MSIGLSHRNGRVGRGGAGPQFRAWLILKTLPCESSLTSRMVSCVNSPMMKDPS